MPYQFDEEETATESTPLRAVLSQLDRTAGEIDKSIAELQDRLGPLLQNVDHPQRTPGDQVKPQHSEVVQIVADVINRLEVTQRRLSEIFSTLEI